MGSQRAPASERLDLADDFLRHKAQSAELFPVHASPFGHPPVVREFIEKAFDGTAHGQRLEQSIDRVAEED